MEKKEKNIIVSELFVDIYRHFNVINQIEKMQTLSKKELFLLLIVVLDKFSDTDVVVKSNLIPFKSEMLEIFDLQDDKESTNKYLLELVDQTGDKYVETDFIKDNSGNSLPDPLKIEEVRDMKLKLIQNK